ncbi:DUF4249 domain-containing protein [Pedobacter sp. KR3-3]|uniref:DUF4249 domain-containing protein n=1 Tax=Pedobacter albus TaxID=3113905 RepID=A0ABU7IBT8_9SPHI|nr:DUF4249 domain-containing protein [Pedobacter sp. KR3-3]MEE1946629.1 DUF4249 domain-containing protein [Pedobacter sp. KR3-3]
MSSTSRYIGYFLIIGCLFSSCEKAIDLQLENATPDYVIEATVSNEAGGAKVLISTTKDFKDNNSFNGVSGAQVSIENNGTAYSLTETSKGIYQAATLVGAPGNSYRLLVSLAGKNYTANCTMPKVVPLDSVYVSQSKYDLNKDNVPRTFAVVKYKDPAGEQNYYRFVQYLNNKKEKTLFTFNDEFTPGQTVNTILNYNNPNDDLSIDLKKGDDLTMEMQCIDATVYKYFYSLRNGASGNGNNAAPSNPLTNIQGGALGYFSAHTTQRKTIKVP